MTDYPEQEQPTAAPIDRGTPIVAQESNMAKILIGAFVVVGMMGMAYVALRPGEQPQKKDEETFKVAGGAGTPYIAQTAPKGPTIKEPTFSEAEPPRVIDLAAQRAIEEERKLMLQRLQSPQIIPVQKAGAGGVPQTQSGGSLTDGEDNENIQFAQRYGSKEPKRMKSKPLGDLSAVIPQGTMIPGVLETGISSNLPGRTRAKVAEDVYSYDGSTLLIPRDSIVVGTYQSSTVRGQDRVFVIWQRLLRPDGTTIVLDSYGTDSLGRTGSVGEVDTHFWERFGSTIMLSLIDGGIQAGVNAANSNNTANVVMSSGNNLSRSAEIALENSINIRPTIHIDQGTRIQIFVEHDMDFGTTETNGQRVNVYR